MHHLVRHFEELNDAVILAMISVDFYFELMGDSKKRYDDKQKLLNCAWEDPFKRLESPDTFSGTTIQWHIWFIRMFMTILFWHWATYGRVPLSYFFFLDQLEIDKTALRFLYKNVRTVNSTALLWHCIHSKWRTKSKRVNFPIKSLRLKIITTPLHKLFKRVSFYAVIYNN